VFDLPYLLRFPQERTVKIFSEGVALLLRCENADSLKILPWLELGKSEIASLVFEHPNERFVLDSSTLRSAITIEMEMVSLAGIPEVPASVLVWQGGQRQRQDISRGKLLYLLSIATKAYNKFVRAYSVVLEEAVNFTYLDPMYENQYPYGVRIYVDGEFVSWTLPVNRVSMIPPEESDWDAIERVCTDSLTLDPIREVFFHSQVLFLKREFELSLISCQQFLESVIDRYLDSASRVFHATEEGTTFEFVPNRPEPVSVMRKYHDVLLDIEGRSLFVERGLWWDDLDIIVQLRNSLLHNLKSVYSESKRHYNLRFADNPIVNFRDSNAPRLSREIRLENEFPRLFSSSVRIASWVESKAYVPGPIKTILPFK